MNGTDSAIQRIYSYASEKGDWPAHLDVSRSEYREIWAAFEDDAARRHAWRCDMATFLTEKGARNVEDPGMFMGTDPPTHLIGVPLTMRIERP